MADEDGEPLAEPVPVPEAVAMPEPLGVAEGVGTLDALCVWLGVVVWLVVGADDGVPDAVALRVAEAPGDAPCVGVEATLRVPDELGVPACVSVRDVVALCVDVLDGLWVSDGDWSCDGEALGVCDAVRV